MATKKQKTSLVKKLAAKLPAAKRAEARQHAVDVALAAKEHADAQHDHHAALVAKARVDTLHEVGAWLIARGFIELGNAVSNGTF